MDELNQIQNPNVPSNSPGQIFPGQVSPSQVSNKKKSSWFIVAIIVLVAVGAFAWWYIGQMGDEPLVIEQPKINEDARADALISGELKDVDMGDLDAEFQAIDKDADSL